MLPFNNINPNNPGFPGNNIPGPGGGGNQSPDYVTIGNSRELTKEEYSARAHDVVNRLQMQSDYNTLHNVKLNIYNRPSFLPLKCQLDLSQQRILHPLLEHDTYLYDYKHHSIMYSPNKQLFIKGTDIKISSDENFVWYVKHRFSMNGVNF
jgi:hypothetical protein